MYKPHSRDRRIAPPRGCHMTGFDCFEPFTRRLWYPLHVALCVGFGASKRLPGEAPAYATQQRLRTSELPVSTPLCLKLQYYTCFFTFSEKDVGWFFILFVLCTLFMSHVEKTTKSIVPLLFLIFRWVRLPKYGIHRPQSLQTLIFFLALLTDYTSKAMPHK